MKDCAFNFGYLLQFSGYSIIIIFFFFTFFYIHKKKVLDSRKFLNFGFRWIYMFWDGLNMTWPSLENVRLSVCMFPKLSGHSISRTNARKLMKPYSVAPWYKLMLIRFWRKSFDRWRCCVTIFNYFLWEWINQVELHQA